MTDKPRNGGESEDRERARLARMLEAAGHGECANDLERADEDGLAEVAYSIADHVEYACANSYLSNPELAAKIREWIDARERADPAVARKIPMPVTVYRKDGVLHVDVYPDDLLDLTVEDDQKVILTMNGEPMFEFDRLDTPGVDMGLS